MKILLVGALSDDPSVYTYAQSFEWALRDVGFTVETFNYRKQRLPQFFESVSTHLMNRSLIKTAQKFKPDTIFLLKAESVFAATIAQLKKQLSCRIINFYPDNPFTIWNGNSNTEVLKSLPLLDCFLSWSTMLAPALTSAGCHHVCSFPFAYDEKIFDPALEFQPATLVPYASDVCFVGTWEPERETWLVYLIQQLPQLDLAIWGNLWKEKCSNQTVKKHVRGNALYNQEMIKAFRAAKIVLNFIRTQNMTAHNMRTFEVPASNAFLLTEYTNEQANIFFTERESVVCFKNRDELVNNVTFYMQHPDKRMHITQKSNDIVKAFALTKQLKNYFKNCRIFNP